MFRTGGACYFSFTLSTSMAVATENRQLQVLLSFQPGLDASKIEHKHRLSFAGGVTVAQVILSYGSWITLPRALDYVTHPGAEVTMFCNTYGANAKVGPDSSCILASFFGIRAAWRPVDKRTKLFELMSGDPSGVIELCLCAATEANATQTQCELSAATRQPKQFAQVSFKTTRSAGTGAVSTCDTLDVVSEGSGTEEPESPCSAREEKVLPRRPTAFRPPPGLELPLCSESAKRTTDGSQRAGKGIRNRALPRRCDECDHSLSSCERSSTNPVNGLYVMQWSL